jgi:hypothetical protein
MKHLKIYESFNKPIYHSYNEKPKIDEKTIRAENPDRDWYVDFYFDEQNRLDYVDNKWNISVPDWYGLKVNIIDIRQWADKYNPNNLVYHIIENDAKKYNL